MKLLSLSLIRGLIYQTVGHLAGMGLTMLIRLMMGLPAWKAEPVWVVGALFGVAAFMVGTGVLHDWFAWAKGEETPEPSLEYSGPGGLARLMNVSYDHKVIGIQYGFTSLLIFIVAGLFALIFRTELVSPQIQFLVPDV